MISDKMIDLADVNRALVNWHQTNMKVVIRLRPKAIKFAVCIQENCIQITYDDNFAKALNLKLFQTINLCNSSYRQPSNSILHITLEKKIPGLQWTSLTKFGTCEAEVRLWCFKPMQDISKITRTVFPWQMVTFFFYFNILCATSYKVNQLYIYIEAGKI